MTGMRQKDAGANKELISLQTYQAEPSRQDRNKKNS